MMKTFSKLIFRLSFLKRNTYVKLSGTQMDPSPFCPVVEAALTASVSNEDPLDPSCYRIQRENNICKATVSYLNVFSLLAQIIRNWYLKTLKYCFLSIFFFNISKFLCIMMPFYDKSQQSYKPKVKVKIKIFINP